LPNKTEKLINYVGSFFVLVLATFNLTLSAICAAITIALFLVYRYYIKPKK